MDERCVVELRVHGVGPATPEGLLGDESSADTVQVGGMGSSGFFARRRDRHVEGYVWASLTSRMFIQPLWLVLFPFTMVNAAGFMHRPDDDRRLGVISTRSSRSILGLIAAALTAAYVLWGANLLINSLYLRD